MRFVVTGLVAGTLVSCIQGAPVEEYDGPFDPVEEMEHSAIGSHEEPGTPDQPSSEIEFLEGSELAAGTVDPWTYVDDVAPEELEMLIAELEAAIAASEMVVEELEIEIAKLEADASRKAAEASMLVASIEQRRREVEADYNRSRDLSLLCVVFGCPPVVTFVSLAAALDSDSRLQDLNRQLAAAQAEQARIEGEIAVYDAQKLILEEELEILRIERSALEEILLYGSMTDVEETIEVLMAHPEIRALRDRVEVLGEIAINLDGQIVVLTEVRDLAVALNEVLDAALLRIRAASERASRIAQESRKALFDLIKILASGDPAAAAERWLEMRIAQTTKQLLKSLDLSVRLFVENLLASDPTDFERRVDEIVTSLLRDAARLPMSATASGLPLAIPDADDRGISRALTFPAIHPVASGTVHVTIEHPYIGDLRVVLRHGTRSAVLHDRTGSTTPNLTLDVPLSAFKGERPFGDWTLQVTDSAGEDVGRLMAYSIDLELAVL